MDDVTSFIARLYDDSYFHGAFHLRDLLYLAYAQFFSGSIRVASENRTTHQGSHQ